MKVKDIQNIILSYDMDYDTIIKYSKEDLTTTLEGLSSSLETVIDNNNNYLINDILEYYIDIFDTIENIDDLDIYVNKIKKIISNLYKTKDITNDNISECINFLQNIISSIQIPRKLLLCLLCRMILKCFHAEADLSVFAVEVNNLSLDLLADGQSVCRFVNVISGDLGYMKQSVYARL